MWGCPWSLLGILKVATQWLLLCSVVPGVSAFTTWLMDKGGIFSTSGPTSLRVVESCDSASAVWCFIRSQ